MWWHTAGNRCYHSDNQLGDEGDGVDDDAEERFEEEHDEDWQHGCTKDEADRCYWDGHHEDQQVDLMATHRRRSAAS